VKNVNLQAVDLSNAKFSEEKQTLFQEIKFAENTKF